MPDYRIVESDCIEAMAAMPEASVDAIVTDPPYGLGFMGKAWDSTFTPADNPMRRSAALDVVNAGASRQGGRQRASADYLKRQARDARIYQEWCQKWGEAAERVLRPGGYILAFGGTRTYHRLASGLEDAGIEVRDMIEWLYGSGFPKHVSTLKPAHEPIMLGRKAGPKATPLQIDACRIGWQSEADEAEAKEKNRHADFGSGPRDNKVYGSDDRARGENGNYDAEGRWPANVALDPAAAAMLDRQSGTSTSRIGKPRSAANGEGWGMTATGAEYDDFGGASRFFYCAKAGRDERNAGLGDEFAAKMLRWSSGDQSPGTFQSDGTDKTARNHHPTVKPIDLMRWLCRLVTPPGGTVLDPFAGSGTTGCAAVLEDFDFIGIEREAEYAAIARARIAHWWKQPVQMGLTLA